MINSKKGSDQILSLERQAVWAEDRYSCSRCRLIFRKIQGYHQKYSRLRCLLCVKGLVICFYLGWSGSILQFRQNIIKVGSKSWLLICSSNITLSLPSYTGSALKRELNFCTAYLSLLHVFLDTTNGGPYRLPAPTNIWL